MAKVRAETAPDTVTDKVTAADRPAKDNASTAAPTVVLRPTVAWGVENVSCSTAAPTLVLVIIVACCGDTCCERDRSVGCDNLVVLRCFRGESIALRVKDPSCLKADPIAGMSRDQMLDCGLRRLFCKETSWQDAVPQRFLESTEALVKGLGRLGKKFRLSLC